MTQEEQKFLDTIKLTGKAEFKPVRWDEKKLEAYVYFKDIEVDGYECTVHVAMNDGNVSPVWVIQTKQEDFYCYGIDINIFKAVALLKERIREKREKNE